MKKRTDIDSTSIGNEAIKSAHANTTGIPDTVKINMEHNKKVNRLRVSGDWDKMYDELNK
jgi:hypothetical protein